MSKPLNKLSPVDEVSGNDSVPVFDTSSGFAKRMAISQLLSWLNTNLSFPSSKLITQYSSPTATGFSVSVAEVDTHLILLPSNGFAAGTIVLPKGSDKSEVLVNSNRAVTALTVSGSSGDTVSGAPTSLSADDFFRLKYDSTMSTWYRVG